MKLKDILSTLIVILISSIVTLPAFSSSLTPDENAAEEAILRQLRQIEINVAAVEERAAELQTMTQVPLAYTWESHHFEWRLIKSDVEEAGNLIPTLQKNSNLTEWHEKAVDRVAARLKAIAHETSEALKYIDENRQSVDFLTHEYETYISTVQNLASDVDSSIDYIQTRDEMEEIKSDYRY